jgi:carboxylesterase type B
VFSISSTPLPTSYFQFIMAEFVGSTRSAAICACPEFALNSSDPDTVRDTLADVGTMFFWTCATQANAIAYHGEANVYLYEMLLGCTHPDNADDPMCVGKVCHQDDIGMVFGTCISPTPQQTALSNEIMGRWVAFATNGNPNKGGDVQWNNVAGSGNLNALRLGPTDVVNQTLYSDLCGPVFGDTVPFNFQLY